MRALTLAILFTACSAGQPAQIKQPKGPEEATLWRICYTAEGDPIYAELPSEKLPCKRPEIVNWGKLPVKVYMDSSMGGSTNAILWAFDAWEDWMGVPVFELTPIVTDDTVVLLHAEGTSLFGAAAMAPHVKRPDGSLEYVVIFWEEYHRQPEVVAHELGHVLGLAHDKFDRESIMYPTTGTVFPELTKGDKRALCQLYGC